MKLYLRILLIGIGLFLIILGALWIKWYVILLVPGIALMYIGVYMVVKYDKGE